MYRLALLPVLLAMLCVAGPAHATGFALSSLPDIPSMIFAALVPADGSMTAIGAEMSLFLVDIIMPLAAAALAFHTLMGTIHTAHEGKVLGQRYHLVLSPIKVCLGIAIVVPMASGFCLASLSVLGVAHFSSDLTTQMQAKYIDYVALGSGLPPSSPNYHPLGLPMPLSGLPIAKQILEYQTCQAAYQVQQDAHGVPSSSAWLPGGSADAVPPKPDSGGVRSTGSQNPVQVWSWGVCGEMSVSAYDSNLAVRSSLMGSSDPQRALMEARVQALGRMIQALDGTGLATQLAKSQQAGTGVEAPASVLPAVRSIASEYDQAVLNASLRFLTDYSPDRQRIADAMKQQWVLFGVGMVTMSAMSQQVTQVASVQPLFSAASISDNFWNRSATRQAARTVELLDKIWEHDSSTVPTVSGSDMAKVADAHSDIITGNIQRLLAPIVEWSVNAFGANLDPNASIQIMIDFGHRALVAGFAILGALLLAAAAAGNAVSAAAGLSLVFITGLPFAFAVVGALIGCGITNAYIIPLLFYFASISFVTGWVLLIIEGVIMAPIWAIGFVRLTEGTDFFCSVVKQGAMMIVKIFMSPFIAVMTMHFAIVIIGILFLLIDLTFAVAFFSGQGGHIDGIVTFAVAISIHSWLKYQAATRVGGYCVELATSKQGNWYGVSNSTHGEAGQNREMHSSINAGAVGSTMSGSGKESISKVDAIRAQHEAGHQIQT